MQSLKLMTIAIVLAMYFGWKIRPFQIDKLLIGLYLLKNLGSVGRLKKENRNMNIIIM